MTKMFGRRKRSGRDPESDVEITDELYLADLDWGDPQSPRRRRPVSINEITDSFANPLYVQLADEPGPYDYEDVREQLAEGQSQRLDLGSIILPLAAGFQLQVEMSQDGTPQAVHLTTEHGRLTVAAYAAPKSAGQWREVAADLAESLRAENARVSVETGPWGREVAASTEGADLRFIGVDGYRWMVRLVAAGPPGSTAAGTRLVESARAVLRDTVVRRGEDPHPVRTPLPVVLPQRLAERLAKAHQDQLAVEEPAMSGPPPGPMGGAVPERPVPRGPKHQAPMPDGSPMHQGPMSGPVPQARGPRRGAEGSAMQQLRR